MILLFLAEDEEMDQTNIIWIELYKIVWHKRKKNGLL